MALPARNNGHAMATAEHPKTNAVPPSLDPSDGPLTFDELNLAFRNRGMPLEAMRYDLTPTGLHYLVVHFDIPEVDLATWRLSIGGRVRQPLELTLDEIRRRPSATLPVTMECAGNGRGRFEPRPMSLPWLDEAIGTAEWTGTPLWPLIEEASPTEEAIELVFRGADRGFQNQDEHDYGRSLSLADARRPEVMLVYAMNGEPLQPQHGAPLRLLVPGWYGMTSVKWLRSIEATSEPFDGYQQAVAYHYKRDADDPGEPVTRLRVRALMIPPGIPDWFTRQRVADAGPIQLTGRAWSGEAAIQRVEVGIDGAWQEATLGPAAGEFAWRPWSFAWDATPGEHELSCRATDSAGNTQPLDPPWNFQGHGNNAVQRFSVTVR
jgi:DMSO/TMAO reductase YedYZ molybdopterin-dependent catalytic subunit